MHCASIRGSYLLMGPSSRTYSTEFNRFQTLAGLLVTTSVPPMRRFNEWYRPNCTLEFPVGGSQALVRLICY
jgi:hypothetical protein